MTRVHGAAFCVFTDTFTRKRMMTTPISGVATSVSHSNYHIDEKSSVFSEKSNYLAIFNTKSVNTLSVA